LVVGPGIKTGIKLHYENPRAIGADRIVNVVGAYEQYGGPLIVIDIGTATTFDVVAENGDFLGGVIAPGIGTSADALFQQAAQLPRIELVPPKQVICRNTIQGMQAGIICVAHDGSVAYRQGAMAYPGDRCIGGWAEVHDKRWSTPVRSEVAMDEYNTHRSLWKSKPLTMIRKVALVQALRESYPDRFAGTYDASEMGRKGEQEPPQAAPAPAQPVQASVEPTRPSEEDVAWLRESVANLVALGYKESEVKGYLWHQYQDGGREAAQQAVVGLIAGAGGTVEQPQEVEPEQEAVEYEAEDIEF
jgi:hypothetical protein